jgi:hypothetical protein
MHRHNIEIARQLHESTFDIVEHGRVEAKHVVDQVLSLVVVV